MLTSIVDSFYTGLAERDGDAMAACYAEEIVFEDPAFGELRGRDVGDMWRMLCSSDTDLRVEHRILESTDSMVRTNWTADYTFTATGNAVHNDIVATMTFRDGKIIEHRDHFDFWKWSSQALGLPGRLFGWAPPLRSKVRSTARGNLAKFQAG
ncbi:MAG: nuclear transport factor 2 family protein [Actinomycetota bacterium]